MNICQNLRDKLHSALNPIHLDIINESYLHKGHQQEFDGMGETHIRIKIVSENFIKMDRLQRHRIINKIAAEELLSGLHALAIEAQTPEEFTMTNKNKSLA